jgi:hypothetical protein
MMWQPPRDLALTFGLQTTLHAEPFVQSFGTLMGQDQMMD